MKKYIFTLLTVITIGLIGCNKEDLGNPVDVQFEFDVVGTVAEQTAEEAKKTINGKWDVDPSASSSKRSVSCSFYGVEFTNDRYALRFDINGVDPNTGESLDESIYAYGPYSLKENSEGLVTAVELFETVDGVDYKIATLTDVVVAENGSDLNATFTVVFDLPDDIAEDFPCGNLDGDYAADKDEPVVSEEAGSGNTNFAKLVNVWRLDSVSIDGEEEEIALFVAEDFADLDENEICESIFGPVLPPDPNIQVEAIFQEIEAATEALNSQIEGIYAESTAAQETIIANITGSETAEEYAAIEAQLEEIQNNANAAVEEIASQVQSIVESSQGQIDAIYAEYDANLPSNEVLEALNEECGEAIEAAAREVAQNINAAIEVTFSAYGSYIFSVSIDGETVDVEVNDWEFTNTDQTRMLVDGETTLIIDRITDTELRVIENVNETDEESGETDQYQAVWSFTRIN